MMLKHKLGNPFLVASLIVLVVNDWFLKQSFGNALTGKLSDFAGLFSFAFFVSALLPRKIGTVHVITALFFIAWKSPLVQPFINYLNSINVPVHRTVDYTDYAALAILPLSYYTFKSSRFYLLRPVVSRGITAVACLAFTATSLPPGKFTRLQNINKTYGFGFSKRELVSRINALQMEYINDLNKGIHYNNKLNYGGLKADTASLDFDSKTSTFYYSSGLNKHKRDTIARIIDYETVKDDDVIPLKTSFANITLSGNEKASAITVISLNRYIRTSDKGDARIQALKNFENLVVKKISKYGKER